MIYGMVSTDFKAEKKTKKQMVSRVKYFMIARYLKANQT